MRVTMDVPCGLSPLRAGIVAALGRDAAPVPLWDLAPSVVAERALQVERLARPLRGLLDELAQGYVDCVQGRPVMEAVDVPGSAPGALLEAPVALLAWVDLMAAIVPATPREALARVARCLAADVQLRPEWVAAARAELELQLQALRAVPAEQVRAGRVLAEIRWAVEGAGLVGVRS